MWSRYTFVCDPDECDALVEFTVRDDFGFPLGVVEMKCPCGRFLNYISYEEAHAPIITDVSKVTPRTVVKIDSNPYNYYMDLKTLIEYMKIHLISLEQDLEENPASIHVVDIEGQIYATQHLLSVAEGMIE